MRLALCKLNSKTNMIFSPQFNLCGLQPILLFPYLQINSIPFPHLTNMCCLFCSTAYITQQQGHSFNSCGFIYWQSGWFLIIIFFSFCYMWGLHKAASFSPTWSRFLLRLLPCEKRLWSAHTTEEECRWGWGRFRSVLTACIACCYSSPLRLDNPSSQSDWLVLISLHQTSDETSQPGRRRITTMLALFTSDCRGWRFLLVSEKDTINMSHKVLLINKMHDYLLKRKQLFIIHKVKRLFCHFEPYRFKRLF